MSSVNQEGLLLETLLISASSNRNPSKYVLDDAAIVDGQLGSTG